MFANFIKTTEQFMDKIDQFVQADPKKGINMFDMFNRLTLEAFTFIAFGAKLDAISAAPKKLRFATAFDRTFRIWPGFVCDVMNGFFFSMACVHEAKVSPSVM